jgi:RimJ/RimL family protein N-acetyltransferase
MDSNPNISDVHSEQSDIHSDRVLTLVDATNEKEMEEIWSHVSKLDYFFDDLTNGDPRLWIITSLLPTSRMYRIADVGIVQLENINPPIGANIHYSLWGEVPLDVGRRALRETFEIVFDKLKLRRLTGIIPTCNPQAKRMALSNGFRFEGCLRQAWLKHGKFYDLDVFGMLCSEYERRKRVN